MTVSGALARPMMAGIFIYGGWDALRDPESKAKAADDVAPLIADALHLPMNDTVTLVRVNGGIQVVAGTMLALGKARRLSALALAASLIPTTYAGHRFWEEVDEERRAQQRIQFLKNVAMLGGLVLAAGDTGGRPSLPWQARRTARHAVEAAASAGASTGATAKHVVDVTVGAKQTVADELSRRARKAAHKAAHQTRQVELAELAQQAKQLARAAKESELTTRAVKAAKSSAKSAKKAEAELSRRARKAARTGAHEAARRVEQADIGKRAREASRAAQRAANSVATMAVENVQKAQLPAYAGAASAKLQQVNRDAVGWAREVATDGTLERLRDHATSAAHQVADRAMEALPIAS